MAWSEPPLGTMSAGRRTLREAERWSASGMDRVRRRFAALPRSANPKDCMADDLDDDLETDPEDLEVLDDDDDDEVLVDADEAFTDDDFSEEDEEGDPPEKEAVAAVTAKAKTAPTKGGKAKSAAGDDEEGADDDDDEPDPDDVEADLDTILKDRLVVADDEEDEDEEEQPEPEDRAEGAKVRPRAPGEFVCHSCFLVKHPSQLADENLLLCQDCV